MAIFFEDIFNDGAQAGVVFKKAPTAAGNTALTAGGAVAIKVGSATTNPGFYTGSGAPTVSAGQGSFYLRSDGSSSSTRLYVNSDGGTTWVAVTTAS